MSTNFQMKKTIDNTSAKWDSNDNDTLLMILNSISEGIIVADKYGNFLFFNPVAGKILGIGKKNVKPAEWTSVYGCYRQDEVTPYPSEQLPLSRAIRNDEVEDEIIFIKNPKRPEGVFINVSACPLKKANGSVRGGIVIFRDITESIKSAKQLRKLSNAIEQTADSAVITNKQGIIEYVNPAFEKTTGYNRKEVLGKTPQILKSNKHNNAFYKKLWSTILSGNTYRGTIINKKKNGDLYWCEQTITPMKDSVGNITNFVSVIKDITELKEKQKQEFRLNIAREIQQRLYKPNISVPGFDIAGATYSAVETGGDYFDFISMPDGHIGLVIGDVSGHGIGSALIMAQTRAYLRAFVKMETDPGIILTWLNQELTADLSEMHYVTLILARLDPQRNLLDYSSAGHLPAYLLNGSGDTSQIMESTGIPLGFIKDYKYYKSEQIKLAPDNILAFFTDGLVETKTHDEIEFGFDRALEIINNHRQSTACQIVEKLYRETFSFSKNQAQKDDITSVICKVNRI